MWHVIIYMWWLCISSSGETWKFDFLRQILPWRSVNSPSPQTIGILTKLFCTFGQNFGDPSLNGWWNMVRTNSNGVNFDFFSSQISQKVLVKFDLEGQCRSLHKTIGTSINAFCIFVPNLVILARTGPEVSRGQASDWLTHSQRQYPKAKCEDMPLLLSLGILKSHYTGWTSLIARFMGPTWGPSDGRQDPCGAHVGPTNFAIWAFALRIYGANYLNSRANHCMTFRHMHGEV